MTLQFTRDNNTKYMAINSNITQVTNTLNDFEKPRKMPPIPRNAVVTTLCKIPLMQLTSF